MNALRPRTTIGLKSTTKAKLDNGKAPGQCYDGFLCQLIELWEKTYGAGKTKENYINQIFPGINESLKDGWFK